MAGRKILYVDDEAPLRDLVHTYLELEGYEVSTASEGAEAIAQLGRQEFDILLLDYHMPGTNGLEVLKYMDSQQIRTRTIVMSGDDGPAVREACARYGVIDCLPKPFDLNVLLSALQECSPPRPSAATEENSPQHLPS